MDLRAGLTKPHPADKTGMTATKRLRLVQFRLTAPTKPVAGHTIGRDFGICLPLPPCPTANTTEETSEASTTEKTSAMKQAETVRADCVQRE